MFEKLVIDHPDEDEECHSSEKMLVAVVFAFFSSLVLLSP